MKRILRASKKNATFLPWIWETLVMVECFVVGGPNTQNLFFSLKCNLNRCHLHCHQNVSPFIFRNQVLSTCTLA